MTGPSTVGCALGANHETRRVYVTTKVGDDFWRIPVYVCVDPKCMRNRGAHKHHEPLPVPMP